MRHMHYLLAIDTGSSSSKLALFDTQGTLSLGAQGWQGYG